MHVSMKNGNYSPSVTLPHTTRLPVMIMEFNYSPEKPLGFDVLYSGTILPVRRDGAWELGHTGYIGQIYSQIRDVLRKTADKKMKVVLSFGENFPEKQRIRLEKLVERAGR